MQLDVIGQYAQHGAFTPLQAQRMAHAFGLDPSALPIRCEAPGCAEVRPLGQMFSMWVMYGMPGLGKAPYMCAQEQHYGCCHDHAKQAMLACLNSHIEAGDHG